MKLNWDGQIIDVDQQLEELDRVDAEESLYKFLKAGWRNIDPSPWKDGWPIEAVAEHLQAVVDGQIRRLIINIPPRMGKSSLCSVALPAWCWAQPRTTPTSGPGVRFLHASYSYPLSIRDSTNCRRLIQSNWYQKHWGRRFNLSRDQNAKVRFSNDKGGERLVTSVGPGGTGEGGQIIVVDDPNAAGEVTSDATIETTIEWWDGTMSTRHNDAATGAYIVVQQRLGEDDLTGHILSKDIGEWTSLILPMHYDPDRNRPTAIGWTDPRTVAGDLLWPERFGPDDVRSLERSLGKFKSAGQLEQSPQPAGGGIIKRDSWQLWPDTPCRTCPSPDRGACVGCGDVRTEYPPMDFIMASLDTAFTEKTINDASALTIWGVFTMDPMATATRIIDRDGRPVYYDRTYAEQAPKVMLMHAWNARLEFRALVEKVADTCKKLKVDMILIEAKAAGHSVAQELRRIYSAENFSVRLYDPKGADKTGRLFSVAHLFEDGMIYAPERPWSNMVIDQVASFPQGKHDDLVDTVSQAIRHMRDMGLLVRTQERIEEIEASKVYSGKPPGPLYPS